MRLVEVEFGWSRLVGSSKPLLHSLILWLVFFPKPIKPTHETNHPQPTINQPQPTITQLEPHHRQVSSANLPASLSAPVPGSCAPWAPLWQQFLQGTCFVSLPGLRTMTMAFLAASGVALAGDPWPRITRRYQYIG